MLPPTWRLIITTIAIASAIVVWAAALMLLRMPESSPARRKWVYAAAAAGVPIWWTFSIMALWPAGQTEYQRAGWTCFYGFGNFLFISVPRLSQTLRQLKIQ